MRPINLALRALSDQLGHSPNRAKIIEELCARQPVKTQTYRDGAWTVKLLVRLLPPQSMQVELCEIQPGVVVPDHCHPNVESIEIPICGAATFHIGRRQFNTVDGREYDFKPWPIPAGVYHGGRTLGSEPAKFLSVQFWRTTPMKSVVDDWIEQ